MHNCLRCVRSQMCIIVRLCASPPFQATMQDTAHIKCLCRSKQSQSTPPCLLYSCLFVMTSAASCRCSAVA